MWYTVFEGLFAGLGGCSRGNKPIFKRAIFNSSSIAGAWWCRFQRFYLGAPFHLEELPESLPPAGTRIDVAIILAPIAENVRGYPREHLARLRPKNIVLSHFNTFAREAPDEQLAFGPLDFVKMPRLSGNVQAAFARNPASHPNFERLFIPAITVIERGSNARNVIRIR